MRTRGHRMGMRLGVLVAVGSVAGVVVAVVLGSGATGTATTRLTPVADAYVSAGSPLRNFGKASSLEVARRPASNAYLRFRVAVPAGRTVTRATLQLFASSRSAAGFTVHRVPSTSWGETTTTYANAPAIRGRVGSSGVHPGTGYVSVDVTTLVTRSGLVSLAVKGLSPLGFRSRESTSGRPRLVVETSGGGAITAPPQTPTPVPTPTPAPTPTPPSTTPPATGGGGGGGGGSGGSGGGGSAGPSPCGTVTTPAKVEHVIWIWMENKPYGAIIGSPAAPYENQLAGWCGLATNYHGVAHPSLPNYIAATSGDTQGLADDEPPPTHPLGAASIYSQLKAAGKTWRDYEESAPGNCPLASSGLYAVKHDPAPYYTGIRSDCLAWDVQMGTTAGGNFLTDLTGGTLPAFSFVTPDLCNDTHDCPIATGDAWLQAWFGKILASPTYLAGKTVIFVAWDEDDDSASNHIPLLVISPSTPIGTQSGASLDHYSLLKTTEQLLGITTFLGHAGDAGTPSMVSTFNLG